MDGEGPKNEPPRRVDLPVFTGKLHIFLVPAPEDGPGMYRFVERHDQIPWRGPEAGKSASQENDLYLSMVLGASAEPADDLTPEPHLAHRRGLRL
jgi:hypothetical protein